MPDNKGASGGMNLDDIWGLHARRTPDKTALIFEDKRITFKECNARICRLGNALKSLGLGEGDKIALLTQNCNQFLEVNAAVTTIGVASVFINYRLTRSEIVYIVNDSDSKAIIMGEDYVGKVREASEDFEQVKHYIVISDTHPEEADGFIGYEKFIAKFPDEKPEKPESRGATIIYTSGTTGKPKGAVRTLKENSTSIMGLLAAFGFRSSDIHLVCGPLYHSAPPAFAGINSIFGATVCIMKRFDPEEALALIEKEKITSTFVVPTMLRQILALPDEIKKKYDISSMRMIVTAAAPLPTTTKLGTLDFFGDILYEFYGSTETGIVTLLTPKDMRSKVRCVGKALPGHDVKLLDEDGNEVKQGEIGEFYVKSDVLLDRYYNKEEAFNKCMRDGYFSVGDLAYMDEEGYYYLVDRTTDMIISGGANIYPKEIEEVLHNHPKVYDAGVIGIPDEKWGEAIKAFIVTKDGETCSEGEIIEFVGKHLASYKKPKSVEFMDEIPRSLQGKILKKELKKKYWKEEKIQI